MSKFPTVGKDKYDKDLAQKHGLNKAQFLVLLFLKKFRRPATYREVEQGTGYYSILTVTMNSKHKQSLAGRGFIREIFHEPMEGERSFIRFQIAPKGQKVFK